MTVSKKVIIFFLLELFVRDTVNYEMLDVIFRPPGTKADAEFPDENGASQEGKPHDLMQLSFSAYGEDFDFLLHRTVSAELHQIEVEIHGSDGSNDSEIRDIRSIYYEFENYTTAVQGYKNRYGQFEGFIMLRNGRTSYYVEPARVHFPDDPALASKSIIYTGDENFVMENSNEHNYSEYRNFTDDYDIEIDDSNDFLEYNESNYNDSSSDSEDIKKSPTTFHFKIELVALASFREYKREDTAAHMFLHLKVADIRVRRTNFGSMTVRLIPAKVTIFESVSDDDYPIKDELPSARQSRFMSAILSNFSESFKQSENDALIAMTHKFYPDSSGVANLEGMCIWYGHAIVTTMDRPSGPRTRNRPLGSTLRTFTHELGHLLGSWHDSQYGKKECMPQSSLGKYIMRAGSAKPKEDLGRFSSCSITNITRYLKKLIKDKNTCAKRVVPLHSCGNGMREDGEECDCGTKDMCEIVDKCCTPPGGNGTDPECTYRRQENKFCSSRDDACCTEDCKIKEAGAECNFGEDGCVVQECDGHYQHCTRFKKIAPVGKPCFAQLGNCSFGSCNKSFCEKSGMTHCNCTGDSACRVCCRKQGDLTCMPAKDLGAFEGEDVFLPHGTKCGTKNETCDISGQCTVEAISDTPEVTSDTLEVITEAPEIITDTSQVVQKHNTVAYVFGVIAALVVLSLVVLAIHWHRNEIRRKSSLAPIVRKEKRPTDP